MDPITPHGFEKLGGTDKKPDPMDIKLGSGAVPTYTHPAALHNSDAWRMPIEYQAKQPACGAHSGAEMKDLALGSRFSPEATWKDLKSFDGWPIDSGTDIRSIFKSITKTGVLDFAQMGNHVELSEQEYASPLSPAQRALMAPHAGQGYGFITDLSWNGLKQFIADRGPTIILLKVGNEWWTAPNGVSSWQEKDILPIRPPQSVVDGHFVVAHSYDDQYIYFLNHWSDGWGRGGHGYFGIDYMPFIKDAGALFPLGFTKDLSIGMTDGDVSKLQAYLNSHGFPVATVGLPGSTGHETNYFGPATKAAVMKFQAAHGISPVSGYFGPLTRAYVQIHA